VYRVSYGNDEAWRRMLRLIETKVKVALEEANVQKDLLARHQLVVMDDASKFDGAGHREVRRHFWEWAAEEFSRNISSQYRPLSDDEWAEVRDQDRGQEGLEGLAGARYTHCWMVDDICLESLDHMHWPVVKVVRKNWWSDYPENTPIRPDWEDGVTDDEEEYVGWMYAHVLEYVSTYGPLCEPDTWHDIYIRPPEINSQTDRRELPRFWRLKQC
jgi:valyl-tRNA synthetase